MDVVRCTWVDGVVEDLIGCRRLDDSCRARPSSQRKNAHCCEMRAACCMLCVTMTIVMSSASSAMVSSILRVEVGSSAEHGSSINSTSGSTASDRAMHRRCCWPPDNAPPGSSRRSLTSFHRPARVRNRSTVSAARGSVEPGSRSAAGPTVTLSAIDIAGNGLGFWKTMPIR